MATTRRWAVFIRSTRPAHAMEASANRLVFDIENINTLSYLLVPVLRPGEMQSIYFLDRESDNVWSFYSMVRTGWNANRAVAFYRHFVGIPTDQEPPAAR